MKRLSKILILIFCLTLTLKSVCADNPKAGEKVNISTWFKMEILNDGKLTDDKMVVELNIFDYQGKLHAVWKDVYIKPLEEKKVVLKVEYNSTDNGTIADVIVRKNGFEFTLFAGTSRTMKIIGTKKEGKYDYSVEGVGLWWSDILNRKIKIEWRTIDKIILPYKEVF